MVEQQRNAEAQQVASRDVMIYEEMSPLKDLVIWGAPGCEAVLAQLLPEDVSLFWQSFDVVKARKEYSGMEGMFRAEGVNAIRMRDVVVNNPSQFQLRVDMPKSVEELRQRLFDKATLFYEKYRDQKGYTVADLDLAKAQISTVLDEEKKEEHLSDEQIIFINTLLSLSEDLPLANIFYARDQSNALGNRIILSNMRREIRQPEVAVFKRAYDILGYSTKLVDLPQGYFEGGDGYILGNKCLIGSGYRTSDEGIKGIFRGVGQHLNAQGIEVYNVANTREFTVPGQEMQAMHLDTFMMPLSESAVLAQDSTYEEEDHGKMVTKQSEVDSRVVQRATIKDGDVVFSDPVPLRRFLDENGIRIVGITRSEQLLYSTNFLHLGHKKIIVPLEDADHARVNGVMANEEGLDVKVAGIKELVGGYGAVHCMTAAIKRG